MLDPALKEQLNNYLTMLQKPIELVAYCDSSVKAQELKQLLEEISSLSDKINLVDGNPSAEIRVPSFNIRSQGGAEQISFAGIPLGHEFTSLVLALLQVGGHPLKLAAETIEQIKNLSGEFSFETYFSLTCQNCPDVVQALNLMALLNPKIKHVAIEGSLFQTEVEQRQIMTVPNVYLNGQEFATGRMSVEEILTKLDAGAAQAQAQALANKPTYDVLVIGGGPAGAAAAIYAARKGLKTAIAAQRFGGQVLDTMSIENFIGTPKTEGPQLVSALEEHVKDYAIDVIKLQQAVKLTKQETFTSIDFASGAKLKGKTIILATGAKWRNLNIPGEEEYRNKGVTYCPHCDGPLFKGKSVAVIGGGNSGVEAALDLAGVVKDVTLLEFSNQLKADAVLQEKLYASSNIKVILNAQTLQVNGDGNKVTSISYKDLTTSKDHTIELAGIFIQVGLVPNSQWLADSGVELTKFGEILVNAKCQTSVAGVFAAGDVSNVPYKQIIIAMGEGSKASLAAFDYLIRN